MEMDDDDGGGGGGGSDLALLSLAPFSLPSPFEDVYVYVTGQTAAAALPATSESGRVVVVVFFFPFFSTL